MTEAMKKAAQIDIGSLLMTTLGGATVRSEG